MRWWKVTGRLAVIMAAMTLLLTGCQGALDPKGPIAKDQYFLILLTSGIMFLVMVVVFALFFYVIIRYRKRKGQEGIPKQVEGNHLLEIIWTSIPFVLLIIIAVPTVMYTFKFAKDYTERKDALQVHVIAHQFWWEFRYELEDGKKIVTAQDLVIPEDKWVSLRLESADVIHSFWVPNLFGKMDANPGIENKMYFKSDEVGVFKGKCAELCGPSHALMDFKVVVKSQADYDAWESNMFAEKSVPAEAAKGEEIFKSQCIACHAVDSSTPSMGPNLNGFADREVVFGIRENNEYWLRRWLTNPQKEKPDNNMRIGQLSEEQIDELVKYLHSLK